MLALNGEGPRIIEEVGQKNVQDIINNSRPRKAKAVLTNILKKYLTKEIFDGLRNHKIPEKDFYQTWRLAA